MKYCEKCDLTFGYEDNYCSKCGGILAAKNVYYAQKVTKAIRYKYCPDCGERYDILDNAKYCKNCGRLL